MNERIKELASQVLDELVPETWTALKYDKIKEIQFRTAELIVQECLGIINKEHDEGIDRHGDYQLALYEAYREIKQHFGVEE